jgi:superfamily I DNA and/or RNA helicase
MAVELSPQIASLKTRFVEALSRELEVARGRNSGTRSNTVIGGTQVSGHKNEYRYEFDKLDGLLEEGIEVTLSLTPTESSEGRYLGELNSKHVFEIRDNLGKVIAEAQVTSDPLFLLEKQIEMLDSDFAYENRIALASVGVAAVDSPLSVALNREFVKDLNSLQSHVLEVARDKSITFIWGPPGTGKTTTIGSLVAALAEAGQRVLMVSNTNLAIDTALERCLDRYTRVKELTPGVMLRIGSMVKPELSSKYGSHIDLDVVYENEAAPILSKISEISKQVEQIQDKVTQDEEVLRKIETRRKTIERLNNAVNEENALKHKVEDLQRQIESNANRVNDLRRELREVSSVGGLKRVLSGKRKPAQVQSSIDGQENLGQGLKKQLEDVVSKSKDKSLELITLRQEADLARAWLDAAEPEEAVKTRVEQARQELQSYQVTIKQLNEELEALRTELLKRARVVACTAYKPLLDRDIRELSFDCVVVDEVSMLPLPLFFCSASRASGRLVIAGDFRQLPPIVKLQNKEDSKWARPGDSAHFRTLTSSPFESSGVTSSNKELVDQSSLVALRDQYRMRSDISDLISNYFYPEHPLKAVNDQRDKPTPWGNESFIVIDSSGLEPESSDQGGSRRNIVQAMLVAAVCERLLKDGWSFDALAPKSLGVVTPYRKQAGLIQEILSLPSASGVHGGISTVHRFQGNERDCIVIDFTRVTSDESPSLGEFVGDTAPFSPHNAKWNVAISRARQHVIIVADLPTLERAPTALFSVLVQSVLPKAKLLDGKSLLEEHIGKSFGTPSKKERGAISWYTGDGFYKAFEKDLMSTRSSLLIASPFVSKRATSRWLPILEQLRDRDVKTVCLTKPTYEINESENALWAHEKLDLVFDSFQQVPKMHEKIAVIDDSIVWLGSLNILSHVSSTEIMIRVNSPEFAQAIAAEYGKSRTRGSGAGAKYGPKKIMKVDDKCDRTGCPGQMVLRPAGFSRASGRPYKAFLSCNQYPNCKNTASFA